MIALLVGVSAQGALVNAEDSTRLKQGEQLRLLRQGGRSRKGLYRCLIAVTDRHVWLKSNERNAHWPLTDDSGKRLRELIREAKASDFTKFSRGTPGWPSAYDGADEYLTIRLGKAIYRGTNYKYIFQGELFEILTSYESRVR